MYKIYLLVLLFGAASCGSGSTGGAKLGESCAGPSAVQCASSLFCSFPQGDCGETGASGFCKEVPEACAEVYQPVCGCSGQTHSNSCFADMNRASLRSDGECPAT
ncbi:MAG: hypothetical protein KDD66_00215 [Bdellovibrionales bacterium]|nr:hypothetical protein [Bdellovibrionales bacterium]